MRLTIKNRLRWGMGLLLSTLIATGLIFYYQVRRINEFIREATEIREPINAAAYEMEINVIGTSLGVMKYLDGSSPAYRARVEEDAAEFKEHLNQYLRLVPSLKEKEIGSRAGNLFEELLSLGHSLILKKDDQRALHKRVTDGFKEIDYIIDNKIQTKIDRNKADGQQKLFQSLSVEADIAEVGTWLGNYLKSAEKVYRDRIYLEIGELKEELIQFKNLRLTEDERHWTAELETLFSQCFSDIDKIVSATEFILEKIPEFIQQRSRLDDLLDDEIQAHSTAKFAQAKEDMFRALTRISSTIVFLVIFGIAVGTVTAWITTKSISVPLDRLVSATTHLSKGDFSQKIIIRSQDEMGDLSDAFNRMGERLATTTVSRNYLDSIVNTMGEALIVILPDGRIESVNQSVHKLLGYSKEDLVGRSIGIIIDEGLPVNASGLKDLMGRNVCENVEKNFLTKDGGKIPVLLSCSAMQDEGGSIERTVFVAMDIGGVKQAENEKQELQSRFFRTQKMEAIGTLAGGIAHDFNNILGVIIGNANLLELSDSLAQADRAAVQQILAAGERAKQLVRQILAFSSQSKQERLFIDMRSIVKETISFLKTTLPKSIEVRQSLPPGAGVIMADPGQMQQVLMNLCTNAAHAMDNQNTGKLEISLEKASIPPEQARFEPDLEAGEFVKMTVTDTGSGIEPWVQQRMFEPYFTTKEVGKGTGLGLSVVHGIVKAHGGVIKVYSEPGKGTSFHVFLPVAETGGGRQPPDLQVTRLPRGSETLLVVDDEKVLADMVKDMLERLGYRVETRTSPVEALEAFRAKPGRYHAVITDLSMPQMSGISLSKKLLEIQADLPILLCTGFSDQANEKKVRAAGIREFAFKPLALSDFAKILRKMLDETATKPENA